MYIVNIPFERTVRIASDRRHRSNLEQGAPATPRVVYLFTSCSCFRFLFHDPHCTRKVIGGELQERLIPVPYSKTSTDQAVRL